MVNVRIKTQRRLQPLIRQQSLLFWHYLSNPIPRGFPLPCHWGLN